MSSEASATVSHGMPQYQLRSDLAMYCLPKANRDDTRNLVWAISICLLFIGIAANGLHQPVFIIRQVAPLPEPIAAEILPPVDQPSPPEEPQPEEPEEETPDVLETPVITPVVVAAPQDVSFSVPVEGYIAISADARYVPPPPAVIPKAPPPDNVRPDFRTIRFGDKVFKKQPPPNYPDEFQRNRIGGTVEALISVDTNGVPSRVEVGHSSGAPALDRHVCDFIRKEWRAIPGETAHYRIAITFAP